ncbi:hypothetical protein [Flavobacterium fryxellicola]|uniref:hypothetical protein n=1 Tax=Flavobacterium fryxellicola TaxID=249352 RepID=UPI0012FC4F1F|nr:hypothetical protein [Flavobacterium fryxellicola]
MLILGDIDIILTKYPEQIKSYKSFLISSISILVILNAVLSSAILFITFGE